MDTMSPGLGQGILIRTSTPSGQLGDFALNHDILGVIEKSDIPTFHMVARICHGSRDIKVSIIPRGHPVESTLDLAAHLVSRLAEIDKRAKRVANIDLRDSYNNVWKKYDNVQEDDAFTTVSKAQLSETEFEAKLSLNAVHVIGGKLIQFFYDDEGMFLGHNLMVSSPHGLDLSEASAQVWG